MPTAARRPHVLLAAVLTILVAAPWLHAEDGASPTERLHRARDLERIHGDDDAALELYVAVYGDPAATPALRGQALRGAAGCHARARRMDQAADCWQRILADDALDAELRAWARERMAAKRRADGETGVSVEEQSRKLREAWQKEQLRNHDSALEDAHRAMTERRYGEARRHALRAQSFFPESREAEALLAEIRTLMPDREEILAQVLQLFRTQDVIEYDRVRREVARLRRAARVGFDHGDWREADRLYREAIRQVDESGFLNLGGVIDPGSLDEQRDLLLFWLRKTHERGTDGGLSFEPLPPLPDLRARQGSLKTRALAFLADVLRPQEPGADAIQFYDFAATSTPPSEIKRSLASDFTEGIQAAQRPGDLTRARWAERTIRRQIGSGWTDPLLREADSASRRKILVRLGNFVCAQSGESEHRRIEALREAFAETPPGLTIDVRVYAADGGGAVRIAEALRFRAGPRDSGLDHVLAGRLLREYEASLVGLEGVQRLGAATVTVDGTSAVALDLTRLTTEHPLFRNLPAPSDVVVDDAVARYGLRLDLYAEDMTTRRGEGDRSALSVVATVSEPDPRVPTHVVPRNGPGDLPWTRLPLLVERRIEADREVPHYGAFVLQGLPNPFPESAAALPELVVLIATTRADTPTPDPPRDVPAPSIVPADLISREYPIGALSIDVEDHMAPEGWPALRTIAEGVSAADRRRLRDGNLANVLMELARIDPESPGGRDAVLVQDHQAVALLSPDAHLQLQQAIQRLRTRENDLYEIRVMSAVVTEARWRQWLALEGVARNPNGNAVVPKSARAALEDELEPMTAQDGLFFTKRLLLARATQQVAHMHVLSRAITKDLAVRRLASGRTRLTPVAGTAEEGLIVEVRPMLESGADGTGVRGVRVRARAARLERIESRPHPAAESTPAHYDVPTWYAGNEVGLSDRRDAEILSDDNALLMPLPLPGGEDKIIAVYVAVRLVR